MECQEGRIINGDISVADEITGLPIRYGLEDQEESRVRVIVPWCPTAMFILRITEIT